MIHDDPAHPLVKRTIALSIPFFICVHGTPGCAHGPGYDELFEREAKALNDCGVNATAAWPEEFECTERERAALECHVSCLEAASCDAFSGMDADANGKYVACYDYCSTFVDLPDGEGDWVKTMNGARNRAVHTLGWLLVVGLATGCEGRTRCDDARSPAARSSWSACLTRRESPPRRALRAPREDINRKARGRPRDAGRAP